MGAPIWEQLGGRKRSAAAAAIPKGEEREEGEEVKRVCTTPERALACLGFAQLAQTLMASLLGTPERRKVLFRHWFKHPFLDHDPSIISNLQYFIGVWLYAPFDVSFELSHGRTASGTSSQGGWLRLMGNTVPRLTIPIALLTSLERKCVMLIVSQSKAAFTTESEDIFRRKLGLTGFAANRALEEHLNRPAFVQVFCQDLVREGGYNHHFLTKDIITLALDKVLQTHNSIPPPPQQHQIIHTIKQIIVMMEPPSPFTQN